MNTLDYYNQHADAFISGTATVAMEELYGHFLPLLKPGATILDLGCGSGRDSKYFMQQGFQITAIDGSPEICKRASEYMNHPVTCMRFDELDFDTQFDGVWACASLLHVPRNDLHDILRRVSTAMRPDGFLYMSFKYGSGERSCKGRHFTDLTNKDVGWLLSGLEQLSLTEMWISTDARPDRTDERWLNLICKKELKQ